jgi:hypothetical protein
MLCGNLNEGGIVSLANGKNMAKILVLMIFWRSLL